MAPQAKSQKTTGKKKGKKAQDAAVPATLASLKKRGLFNKDLPNMMYGYGDTKNHYQATVDLVEDITIEYATALTQSAMDRTSTGKAGKLQAEDVLFVVRKDPKKVARGMQLLQLNEEIKSAKKVSAIAPSTPADILVKDFATTGHALPVGKDSVFTSLAA